MKNKKEKIKNSEGLEVNIDNLSMSHIVQYNPIIYANEITKKKYLFCLTKYINIAGASKRKYIKAQIAAYRTIINSYEPVENNSYLIDDFKYYILLDLLNIVGFDKKGLSSGKLKKIQCAYLNDFKTADVKVCNRILTLLKNDKIELNKVIQKNLSSDESKYLDYIQQNIKFKEEKPFKLLVTATMSAGKSTFINSLTGKNVCRSQNMACTSKIHMIINKAYQYALSC